MIDSTIKPTNRIQCHFHSKTDSTIKPTNRIQQNPQIGFNVNSIHRPLNPQIALNLFVGLMVQFVLSLNGIDLES